MNAARPPGNPGALRSSAAQFATASGRMAEAANRVHGAGHRALAGWAGLAAFAFAAEAADLGEKFGRGAAAFASASSTLGRYADLLEEAQRRADLALFDGQAAANAVQAASASAGPGKAGQLADANQSLAAAEAALQGAWEEAVAGANLAAVQLEQAAAMAPREPPPAPPAQPKDDRPWWQKAAGWVGDRAQDVAGFGVDFAKGVGDFAVGIGQLGVTVVRLSGPYALFDPQGSQQEWDRLGAGFQYAWDHPLEAGKALVDWKDLTGGHPGRAIGQWAPNIALTVFTAGGGLAAKGAEGGVALEEAATAASTASKLERAAVALEDLSQTELEGLAAARSAELQAALPAASEGRVTMSAGVLRDGEGNLHVVVATSEPRGYLRPGVTVNPGETVVSGTGHAEADIVAYARDRGWEVVTVGAGRPHCPACVGAVEGAGGTTASPRRPR